jgi:hypothetical protein
VGVDGMLELHVGDIAHAHQAVESFQEFLLLRYQFTRPQVEAVAAC